MKVGVVFIVAVLTLSETLPTDTGRVASISETRSDDEAIAHSATVSDSGSKPAEHREPESTARPPGAVQSSPTVAAYINSLKMEFVPVKATPKLLWSRWETRVQDYEAFCRDTNRAHKNPDFPQGGDHPVVNVTFHDARSFCEWLSRKDGRPYRLPTDHEWSGAVGIAALENAGDSVRKKQLHRIRDIYPWGKDWPPPPGSGNFSYKLKSDPYDETSPVGKFAPSADGLFDLSGNVREWCDTKWEPEDDARVVRGGSWGNVDPDSLLSSSREREPVGRCRDYVGFRVVLEVE